MGRKAGDPDSDYAKFILACVIGAVCVIAFVYSVNGGW